MAKKKFYAVKVGKIPGIYGTWSEAEEQVKGVSGAVYKSFFTEKEAIEYISCEEIKSCENLSDEINDINKKIEEEIKNLQDGEVIAFVDGSYCVVDEIEKYSFGVVLLTNDSENNLYRAFANKTYMESRNILGEIEGVKQAISWAIKNEKREIKIFYDYIGIEKWATGEWKPRVHVSQEYCKFLSDNSKLINIEFEHVKAHSGIFYNEKADELASRALLSQGYKTYNDGSIYFVGFQKKDWLGMIELLNNEVNEEYINYRINVEESSPKAYMDKLLLTLDDQRVIINCYKGEKSYVQGKQSFLFQRIISLAIEKLPTEDAVIEVLNTYHALTVKDHELENAFSVVMPNFPINEADTKLRNTLLSAVYNTLIKGLMPDYTFLVTPLFRAMEFYLHRILHDKLGNDTTRTGRNGKFIGNNFGYFSRNEATNKFEYNSDKADLSPEQMDFLNELYNKYNEIRHPYSHWAENSVDTEVITDLQTAQDLILEGLKFLDEYYIIF